MPAVDQMNKFRI